MTRNGHKYQQRGPDAPTLCTLSEAAKVMGLTKQGAHAVERRALAKLKIGLIAVGVKAQWFAVMIIGLILLCGCAPLMATEENIECAVYGMTHSPRQIQPIIASTQPEDAP